MLPVTDNPMHHDRDGGCLLEKTPRTDTGALDVDSMKMEKPREIPDNSNLSLVELQSDCVSLRTDLSEASSLTQEQKLDKVPADMLYAGTGPRTIKDAAGECNNSDKKELDAICDARKEDVEDDSAEIAEVLNFLDESIDFEPLEGDEMNPKPVNGNREEDGFTSEVNLFAELQTVDAGLRHSEEEQVPLVIETQEDEHPLSSEMLDNQSKMDHRSEKDIDPERELIEDNVVDSRNVPESDNHDETEQVTGPRDETEGMLVVVPAEPSDCPDGATIQESQLLISDRSDMTNAEISSASDQMELGVICDVKKDSSEVTDVLNYLDENIDCGAVGLSDSLIYTTSPMRKNKESVSLELEEQFDRVESGKRAEESDSQSDGEVSEEASDDEQDVGSDGDDVEIVEMMGLDYSLNEISRSFIKEVMMDAIRDVKSGRKRRGSRQPSTEDSISHSDLENISPIKTTGRDPTVIGSDRHDDRGVRLSVVALSPQVCCWFGLCLHRILLCATLVLSCCMCMHCLYLGFIASALKACQNGNDGEYVYIFA